MTWERITALVIVCVVVGLILYDLFAYFAFGNDATLSKTCLDMSYKYRWFAVLFSFSFGVLIGHLFLPQSKP
jgi:hypothetical protein